MAGIDDIGSHRVPIVDSEQNELMTQVSGNKADAAVATPDAVSSEIAYLKGILGAGGGSLVDAQVRVIQSGTQAILAAATEWLHIDSGTNGAEILSIAIEGLVGHDWTLATYVPAADAVAAPAAADRRDVIAYLAADTEGGLLKPFGIPFNAYLQFTNDGANDQIDQVTITYRSRAVLTLAWGA